MSYHLLTGATGLLGRYLLKDLLLAGVPVAVLVRPTRRASVRQRVESLMCYWDNLLGKPLPRPVVLEGDISEPGLGLDANARDWVKAHCSAMIHNAASLTFHSTGPDAEPWRSNVHGTRHVLDLCRETGIRKFHHVSTAYTCGLRHGTVYETELDVGQELGNDYEQSKVMAEKMVREADFIDPPTVYRPSIIIGDSKTGFTNTFHGFYAPLQIVHTICKLQGTNETGLLQALARLALDGYESKNLVPVDWVSEASTHILTHPELHGETYHLVPQHAVPVRLVRDILEEAAKFYAVRLEGAGTKLENMTDGEQVFYEHMTVYNSYWRDDPIFDTTNIRRAAPHLPCPHVDYKMLMFLANWAVKDNFGGVRVKPIEPDFDAYTHLQPLMKTPASVKQAERVLGLQVDGHGGGQWHVVLQGGRPVSVDMGVAASCSAVYQLDVDTFASLARGQVTADQAFANGRLEIRGNGLSKPELLGVLQQVATVAAE